MVGCVSVCARISAGFASLSYTLSVLSLFSGALFAEWESTREKKKEERRTEGGEESGESNCGERILEKVQEKEKEMLDFRSLCNVGGFL